MRNDKSHSVTCHLPPCFLAKARRGVNLTKSSPASAVATATLGGTSLSPRSSRRPGYGGLRPDEKPEPERGRRRQAFILKLQLSIVNCQFFKQGQIYDDIKCIPACTGDPPEADPAQAGTKETGSGNMGQLK